MVFRSRRMARMGLLLLLAGAVLLGAGMAFGPGGVLVALSAATCVGALIVSARSRTAASRRRTPGVRPISEKVWEPGQRDAYDACRRETEGRPLAVGLACWGCGESTWISRLYGWDVQRDRAHEWIGQHRHGREFAPVWEAWPRTAHVVEYVARRFGPDGEPNGPATDAEVCR